MTAVSTKEAARQLGISQATMRRLIREGCPVEDLGYGAPGKGSMVDPVKVAAWKARRKLGGIEERNELSIMAEHLRDFVKRDCGLFDGEPSRAHQIAKISESAAALYSVLFWRYAYVRLLGRGPEEWEVPRAIHELLRMCERAQK